MRIAEDDLEPVTEDYRDRADFKRFTALVLRFISERTTGTKYAHFTRDRAKRFTNGLWLNDAIEALENAGKIRREVKGVDRFFVGGIEITPIDHTRANWIHQGRKIAPDFS